MTLATSPVPPPWCGRLRLALAGAALSLAALAARGAELTVSAAASLGPAFKEMATAFEAAHPGHTVRLNVAASGTLLQQLRQGAPVDVLATADEATMDAAQAEGLLRPGSRRAIAGNTLVLVVPLGARVRPADLRGLQAPGLARIAIGHPGSVPAGRYAQAALEAAGLWAALQPRLVQAHSVRQALDYVAREEAQAGFVYATDAAAMKHRVQVAFAVPTLAPVRCPAAVAAASTQPELAQRFLALLASEAGRAVLARHGFTIP